MSLDAVTRRLRDLDQRLGGISTQSPAESQIVECLMVLVDIVDDLARAAEPKNNED